MNSEILLQQEESFSEQRASGTCPAIMNALNAGVISCTLDEHLTFRWGNSAFFDQTGYTEEEFHQLYPKLDRLYEGYREDFEILKREIFQAADNGRQRAEMTVRLPQKAGSFLWVRVSVTVTKEGVPGFQAVFTDVSALVSEKEAQTRLHEQKLQYFQMMMDIYDGNIYICDMASYELLYVNSTTCETLGAPADKLTGKKCYEMIQGRTSPCPFCTNDRLREDEFYDWEFFNPVLDRNFMIKNRIINWDGHRARIELSHDMYSTEYKLAKKDREREALIGSIPGGFYRLDARDLRSILWYSADFLDIIEYTAEEFVREQNSQIHDIICEDDYNRIVSMLQKMTFSGENVVTEVKVMTRGGKIKISTMTLCYASGEDSWDGVPSFYSVAIDVTQDRKEQDRQRKALEDAYEVARVSNDAKTNFLSSMSHDIRTPMNAIIGMAVIAQANVTTPEKVQDCLDKISVSSRHLLNLINEVLDMSKIESGKIDLISEVVSLPGLFENVMDMCRPLAEEKHQELRISIDHVRHENVLTDGSRLEQVFMNLLSNAVKYTQDGGAINLRIREVLSILEKKGQYEFIISDNGIGMSEDFMPHIFEPFSRAEDSRISKIRGTGLGMAITENIIRMMNGTIAVRSELGKGSRFIVSVPFELCMEEQSCDVQLTGYPVLVVDDDEIVCESAAALLTELGMRGYWVLSGKEAVPRVVQAHETADDFFAVILDWKMPEMNGLETVRAIREKLGNDVPIIIISAYDYSEIEEEFRKAGADAFITKPLFKSKMLHVLQLFCRCSSSEPEDVVPREKPAALAKKRVLLAEDNDLNREIAVELLRMNGIFVDTAEDGRVAVEKFREARPGYYDGILMDIQMPVLNGYEATEEIRALDRADAQSIPILALTANAFASDLGKTRSAGMNDHIAKPIDVDHLIEVLQKWMCQD